MSNGPVAAGTAMAWGAAEGGAAAGETRAITLASAVAVGRGRGRGANINLPAWMANDDGPRAAQAAAEADAEAAVGAVTGEAAQVSATEEDATESLPATPEANSAVGEVLTEAEAGMLITGGTAAEIAARAQRPPRPANWDTMTRGQRKYWKQHGGKPR